MRRYIPLQWAMELGTDILESIWDGRYACEMGEGQKEDFLQTRVEKMMMGGYEVMNEE